MNKNQQVFKKILFEAIDDFVDNLDVKKQKPGILKELFMLNTDNFVRNIGTQDFENSTELDVELWDWFQETLKESMNEDSKAWIELLRSQKLKILCYKYFTKKDLLKPEKLEKVLKKDLQKYFSSLQNYSDLDSFRLKVENLPSDILTNLIRYLLYTNKELQDKIKIPKEEFKEKVIELKTERMKMAEKLSMVSKKYQTVLDLKKVKELFNYGVFFEDSIINRAVNEYVVKLVNYDVTLKNLKEIYPSALLNDLKYQAENAVAYTKHIEEVQNETSQLFFTDKGYQIGSRFENAILQVKDKDTENAVINKDSVFQEPIRKLMNTPWSDGGAGAAPGDETDAEGGSTSSGGGGGASFGGGGGGGATDFGTEVPDGIDDGSGAVAAAGDVAQGVEGEGGDEGTETELPKDDQGFPVDFGSQETNPEAAEETPEEKK